LRAGVEGMAGSILTPVEMVKFGWFFYRTSNGAIENA
jgi:hypothetical protein